MPTRIGLEGPWPYGHLNCSNQRILTPGRVPRQISRSPAFSDTCPQFGLDSGFLLRGCFSSGYLYVGTGETAYAIALSAPFSLTRRACQKSQAHAAGTPPRATRCHVTPAPVRPRDAISPAPQPAPQCPASICQPNARAKTARRKTPPRAAEIQIPSASLPERIGPKPPARKRSL